MQFYWRIVARFSEKNRVPACGKPNYQPDRPRDCSVLNISRLEYLFANKYRSESVLRRARIRIFRRNSSGNLADEYHPITHGAATDAVPRRVARRQREKPAAALHTAFAERAAQRHHRTSPSWTPRSPVLLESRRALAALARTSRFSQIEIAARPSTSIVAPQRDRARQR